MAVNNDLNRTLYTWKHRELTEFSEAPMPVRIAGIVIVSLITAIAII